MLVVALGVTAAVVVPRVLQAQRAEEDTALADDLRVAVGEEARAHTTLHAATALTYVRHGEALSVAHAVAALGASDGPMLPAEQTQLLGETGTSATETPGPLEDVTDELIEEL